MIGRLSDVQESERQGGKVQVRSQENPRQTVTVAQSGMIRASDLSRLEGPRAESILHQIGLSFERRPPDVLQSRSTLCQGLPFDARIPPNATTPRGALRDAEGRPGNLTRYADADELVPKVWGVKSGQGLSPRPPETRRRPPDPGHDDAIRQGCERAPGENAANPSTAPCSHRDLAHTPGRLDPKHKDHPSGRGSGKVGREFATSSPNWVLIYRKDDVRLGAWPHRVALRSLRVGFSPRVFFTEVATGRKPRGLSRPSSMAPLDFGVAQDHCRELGNALRSELIRPDRDELGPPSRDGAGSLIQGPDHPGDRSPRRRNQP